MKKLRMAAIVVAIIAGSISLSSAEDNKVFHGQISDSQCALNVHSLTRSHQEMLKSKSMGGTPRDCTLYCVNYHGGDFVLSSKKDVYRLDNQDLARTFAGKEVKITGSMEADKKTIHIVKMEEE